jgi:hypothetical protein
VFVFNFHPTSSYTDYKVGCYKPGNYKVSESRGWLNLPSMYLMASMASKT